MKKFQMVATFYKELGLRRSKWKLLEIR